MAHVEAGLRSFNRQMPEEINRVLTDHISALLFCPTKAAVVNLTNEGITKGVHHVGDVMYDAAIVFAELSDAKSTILQELNLISKEFILATVHRAENTDDPTRLNNILAAFEQLDKPVIFPIHPRTRQKISNFKSNNIRFIEPLSFLGMVQLEKNSYCILTDSGGVQKEAYFHGVPCVTLRDETEWIETVDAGWNKVVGADTEKICEAVSRVKNGLLISEYGDGSVSKYVVNYIIEH